MKNKDVSNLIKELRNSTINNWEKGTRTPHPFLFQKLIEMAEEAGLKNIESIKRSRK